MPSLVMVFIGIDHYFFAIIIVIILLVEAMTVVNEESVKVTIASIVMNALSVVLFIFLVLKLLQRYRKQPGKQDFEEEEKLYYRKSKRPQGLF